jgi:thiol-disulfide isomerase/thioredoxin
MITWLRNMLAMLAMLAMPAAAAPALAIKPFTASSMEEILAARKGKPFILGLWSLSCTHCRDDLALLSKLSQRKPGLDLVLIATDEAEQATEAAETLKPYRFRKVEPWIFGDEFSERLRYSIDRKWRGELPRTYFYDAAHQARAVSGKLDELETERWINSQFGR